MPSGDAAVGPGRADQHDLGHARRPWPGTSVISAVDTSGRQGVGHVAAGPVDRPDQLADLDRPVVVDDLVAQLGGVVGGDVVVGGLERVAQVGGDGVERGPHLGRRAPAGRRARRRRSARRTGAGRRRRRPHLVEHRPHLVDGRLGLGGGARQASTQVVGGPARRVESAERDRYRHTVVRRSSRLSTTDNVTGPDRNARHAECCASRTTGPSCPPWPRASTTWPLGSPPRAIASRARPRADRGRRALRGRAVAPHRRPQARPGAARHAMTGGATASARVENDDGAPMGRRRGDVRRRIPTSLWNQVAGTWLRSHVIASQRAEGYGRPKIGHVSFMNS